MVRILKILEELPKEKYSTDRIKLYDYFYLFPTELKIVTVPHAWTHIKRLKRETKFNGVQNSQGTFKRLVGFQSIAFSALSSIGLIDNELLKNDFIKRTELKINLVLDYDSVERSYVEFLVRYANNLDLKELKLRTKLMQHRYELA